MVPSALAAVWLCGAAAAATEGTPNPTLTFRLFANTGHNLDAILWTGRQFLYVENTPYTTRAAPGAGVPLHRFAGMPRLVEETRCVISPGTNGYPPNVVFYHSPDDTIFEISADGSRVTMFATLPVPASTTADGALAVDMVGRFGHQLVAATGRSGAKEPQGGAVYTSGGGVVVKEVGGYSGPGADEVVIEPSGFGSAAGEALLTLDGGATTGALVAMDASGRTRTLANLPGGLNPIQPIPTTISPRRPCPPASTSRTTSAPTCTSPRPPNSNASGATWSSTARTRRSSGSSNPRATATSSFLSVARFTVTPTALRAARSSAEWADASR
jgi:hypothetical protein